MLKALALFSDNLARARQQSELYESLTQTVVSPPFAFDDLLRAQVIYSVSAFDKLLHDVVRIGMVETYTGKRAPTKRYSAEGISLALHAELQAATVPPAEVIFDHEVVRRLRLDSYQEPEKIAAGLALCWPEDHKWQKIATEMGEDQHHLRTKLKLISTRRNAMVHEADIDPISHTRTHISLSEANDVTDFLEKCGTAIVTLVK